MQPPSIQTQSVEEQRNVLLHAHARNLTHEINNLILLAEISAREPSTRVAGELKRGLNLARRLARVLSEGLTPLPKTRLVHFGEWLEDFQESVVKPAKGQLPEIVCEPNAVTALWFREQQSGSLLLLAHGLLRLADSQASARLIPGKDPGTVELSITPAPPHSGEADFLKAMAQTQKWQLCYEPQAVRLVIPITREG